MKHSLSTMVCTISQIVSVLIRSISGPPCARSARDLLNTAATKYVRGFGDTHPIFNEVLSIAYMEEQGMGFHSDNEANIGDTVGSLSLGSSARMKFRVKAKDRNSINSRSCQPRVVLTLGLNHVRANLFFVKAHFTVLMLVAHN